MKKVFLLMAMVLPMVFCGCSKDDEERSLNEYERLFFRDMGRIREHSWL